VVRTLFDQTKLFLRLFRRVLRFVHSLLVYHLDPI
jgi:hypothetical protein